jgi:hypothetical protein
MELATLRARKYYEASLMELPEIAETQCIPYLIHLTRRERHRGYHDNVPQLMVTSLLPIHFFFFSPVSAFDMEGKNHHSFQFPL